MNPTDPILDPQAIASLREINPEDAGEFVRELVDIFLADTPQRFAEMEQALAAGDAGKLARAAHSIKGSASNFGATHLTELARELEARGKANDLAAARAAVPGLQAEFARVRPALERLKSGT